MTTATERRIWTVIAYSHKAPNGTGPIDLWLCRCDCGTERPVRVRGLFNGTSKSCGCYSVERREICGAFTVKAKAGYTKFGAECDVE